MTLADYSLAAFALLNGGRAIAYFPQMIRVYRDPHGAAAVSVATWALFAASNVATVGYALTVANDLVVAIVFAMNSAGCLAIVGLTAFKRLSVTPRRTPPRPQIASVRHPEDSIGNEAAAKVAPIDGGRDHSPRLRHRDDMIRQGLMS